MDLIRREDAMQAFCDHCDDRMIACDGCGLREIIAAIPSGITTCDKCVMSRGECIDIWGNPAIKCITGQTHPHGWFCADGEKKDKQNSIDLFIDGHLHMGESEQEDAE